MLVDSFPVHKEFVRYDSVSWSMLGTDKVDVYKDPHKPATFTIFDKSMFQPKYIIDISITLIYSKINI